MVGLDNFVTGAAENLAHLEGHPCFELIRHDICAPLRIDGTSTPCAGEPWWASPSKLCCWAGACAG